LANDKHVFRVEGFRARELGNSSYLVTDQTAGVAVAIDPTRDIQKMLEVAGELEVKITHAIDTHLHNDYVSGCRELADEVGANIDEVPAGGELRAGDLVLRAIHTPGHTPTHKSYLVNQVAGDRKFLFSGGAVMLGAIARTDLFGQHLAAHLALEAMSTLHVRLRELPDDVMVFPTHGNGSFCGTGGRGGDHTTLGEERKSNPFFQMTEVMPFLARALNQPRYPTYYRDMAAINLAGAPLLGSPIPPLRKLSPQEVALMAEEGAAVVDVREGRDFDRGHIPGSFNVGISGPVSAWVGWLIPRGRLIVLIGGTERDLGRAQLELLRIGYDSIAGALDGGVEAWSAAGNQVATFETVDVEDMAQWVLSAEPMTVVDVRDDHEWFEGHVPGALHIYVPDVPARAGEISIDAPVAVHCASGYRAGIAASLLEQAGLTRIIHVNGEYSDWDRLHLAESVP
jgi:hydroxyacylglutathione hydrolase